MPTQETLMNFREGLKVLQNVNDFATLQKTIDTMVSFCPQEDLPLAKDAIARVLRVKQAKELNQVNGYPQAIEELDKKYRDLYIVLRTSESNVVKALPHNQNPNPQPNQMMRSPGPLGNVGGVPGMLLNWLRSKRKYIIAGGAIGAVGGAYMLYKQVTTDKKPEKKEESNFDKTIKSIQKYKAFTSMMNDPNFSGDYMDIINGNYEAPKKKKKRKELKKDKEPKKSLEWDREEKSLMKDMDDAFSAIAAKPELDYQLPQLPAPKNVDPLELIGDDKPLEMSSITDQTKTREAKPKEKPKKQKRRRRKNKSSTTTSTSEVATPPTTTASTPAEPETKVKKPKKSKKPRVKKTKVASSEDSPGRLIPIVKRTKRVKKVNA